MSMFDIYGPKWTIRSNRNSFVRCEESVTRSFRRLPHECPLLALSYDRLVCGATCRRTPAFGMSVYLGLQRYLDSMLQNTLASECLTIGTELLSQLPSKNEEWLNSEINEAYAPEVNERFIRVYREGWGVIYRSGAPKDGAFDPSQIPLELGKQKDGVSRALLAGGQQLLVNTMRFTTSDGSHFVVESGIPYRQIQVVLHGLFLTLAIYTPFLVLLAIVGGYWLMRRSLRPVDEITERAEGITSTNLSDRLPVIRTGDELERLSEALNRMIARLEDAFQHINRFSADASHELRTPLTILQLELEGIAHQSLNSSLEDQIASALEETNRMSRIVESLLTISRLDAGDARLERVHLDLGDIATLTVVEMKILAQEKSISLRAFAESSVCVRVIAVACSRSLSISYTMRSSAQGRAAR